MNVGEVFVVVSIVCGILLYIIRILPLPFYLIRSPKVVRQYSNWCDGPKLLRLNHAEKLKIILPVKYQLAVERIWSQQVSKEENIIVFGANDVAEYLLTNPKFAEKCGEVVDSYRQGQIVDKKILPASALKGFANGTIIITAIKHASDIINVIEDSCDKSTLRIVRMDEEVAIITKGPCLLRKSIKILLQFKLIVDSLSRVFSSIRYPIPAIKMERVGIHLFTRIFSDPIRPFVDRSFGDYYSGMPEYMNEMKEIDKSVIVFRSRFHACIFPLRYIVEPLLCKVLLYIAFLVYVFGIICFTTLSCIVSFIYKKQIAQEVNGLEKVNWFNDYIEYLNEKCAPWEFGFLLFKALEGFHFRKALSHFGVQHPNCEFGVEDAVVSTVHLSTVNYVDVGCEVLEDTTLIGDMNYKNFANCYIENNNFNDDEFQQIYLIHVVDHIHDLERALCELNRITAIGGQLFLSGVTNVLKEYYLDKFIYQGTLFNAEGLSWYEELSKRCGFKIRYKSYMHSGINLSLWKFTVFFQHRTHIWYLFTNLYKKNPYFYRLYWWIARKMLLNMYLLDEFFVSVNKVGLNFMLVLEKENSVKGYVKKFI